MSKNYPTLTEQTMYALIGKTFEHLYEGKVISRGIIVGMVGPNALQLVSTKEGTGEERFFILSATEVGFDEVKETGFVFSFDNPHREELAG